MVKPGLGPKSSVVLWASSQSSDELCAGRLAPGIFDNLAEQSKPAQTQARTKACRSDFLQQPNLVPGECGCHSTPAVFWRVPGGQVQGSTGEEELRAGCANIPGKRWIPVGPAGISGSVHPIIHH